MQLPDHVLSWLRQDGNAADPGDLEATYQADETTPWGTSTVRPVDETDIACCSWMAELYDEQGGRMTAGAAIVRVLRLSEVREILHDSFWLSESHRRRGIARCIHERELSTYRKWGLRKITLFAESDGQIVWIKNFGFEPVDPALVRAEYDAWYASEGGADLPPEVPSNWADLPESFLRDWDFSEPLQLQKLLERGGQ